MRLTPAGTSEFTHTSLPGRLKIDGKIYPEGFIVGTSGWAYGRNEEIYDDSSIYRPERWIVNEAKGTMAESIVQIKSSFHSFVVGPENCVGQNLAVLELMLLITRTFYRMDVRLASGSMLGEGTSELAWGRRDKNQFQVKDAYIAVRHGPMIQFWKCQL